MDRQDRYVALLFASGRSELVDLAAALAEQTIAVRTARTDAEVLAALADGRVDVAFVDVCGNPASGWSAVRALHQRAAVVALVDDVRQIDEAREAGARSFLHCPWSPAAFRFGLEALLRELSLTRERDALAGELKRLRRTDPLTGLWTADVGLELLEREFARSRRYGRPLSVALLDVDRLGRINRRRGSDQGDETLRSVAHVVHGLVRLPDIVTRLGGDEVLVIACDTDLERAWALAERLRKQVAQDVQKGRMAVTVSLGVATIRSLHTTVAGDLVEAARRAVAQAKSSGRNRTMVAQH